MPARAEAEASAARPGAAMGAATAAPAGAATRAESSAEAIAVTGGEWRRGEAYASARECVSGNGVRKRPRGARVRGRVHAHDRPRAGRRVPQLRASPRLARLTARSRPRSRTPHAARRACSRSRSRSRSRSPRRRSVGEPRGCAQRARELAAMQEADVAVPAASQQPCSRALDGAGVDGWVGLVHPRLEPRGR